MEGGIATNPSPIRRNAGRTPLSYGISCCPWRTRVTIYVEHSVSTTCSTGVTVIQSARRTHTCRRCRPSEGRCWFRQSSGYKAKPLPRISERINNGSRERIRRYCPANPSLLPSESVVVSVRQVHGLTCFGLQDEPFHGPAGVPGRQEVASVTQLANEQFTISSGHRNAGEQPMRLGIEYIQVLESLSDAPCLSGLIQP